MGDYTTYDTVLQNVYLPAIRERVGASNLHWIPEDGRILIWNDRKRRYGATIGGVAPDGEFVWGTVFIYEELINDLRGKEVEFLHALSAEIKGLTEDLRIEWQKHV